MRKTLTIIIGLAFILGLSSLTFAQQTKSSVHFKKPQVAMEVIQGKITAFDSAKNEIVVKDNKTAQNRTFVVNPKVISTLTLNEEVRIKVKEGSNSAESVTVVKPKIKKK